MCLNLSIISSNLGHYNRLRLLRGLTFVLRRQPSSLTLNIFLQSFAGKVYKLNHFGTLIHWLKMSVFAGLCGMFKASLTAYSLSPARSRVSMSSQSWLDKMEVLSTHPYWLNKMVLCDDTCAPSSARNNCAVVQASGADAQVYHYWLTNAAVIGRVRSDMLAFCFIYKSSPSYIIDQIQLALY